MRWDQFTVMSQEAIQKAQSLAGGRGHQENRHEHLLAGFLDQDENIVNAILAKIGAPAGKIRAVVEAALERLEVDASSDTRRNESLRMERAFSPQFAFFRNPGAKPIGVNLGQIAIRNLDVDLDLDLDVDFLKFAEVHARSVD